MKIKNVNIYSKVFLKSGNVVETTNAIEIPDIDGLEEDIKQSCKSLANVYIGESDSSEHITCGNLDIIKGMFTFRTENVEAAIVTYEIFDE